MSKPKKVFECGHKVNGQICHVCLQADVSNRQNQAEKRDWRDSFSFDPIDLNNLPAHVILKARNIIEALKECRDYREFHGKRLRHDRWRSLSFGESVISIPVTRNYRMLCCDRNGILEPKQVLSHGAYNVCKPGG